MKTKIKYRWNSNNVIGAYIKKTGLEKTLEKVIPVAGFEKTLNEIASTKEFIAYLIKRYNDDPVKQKIHLKIGPDTQEILKYISEHDVKLALHTFYQIREYLSQHPLKKIPKYPEAELRGIEKRLTKLVELGLKSQDECQRILVDLHFNVSSGQLRSRNKERLRHGRGDYKDYDMDALCFSLVYMLRKSNLSFEQCSYLVAGFLSEQKITNEKSDNDPAAYNKAAYIIRRRNRQDMDSFLEKLRALGTLMTLEAGYTVIFPSFLIRLLEYKGEEKS